MGQGSAHSSLGFEEVKGQVWVQLLGASVGLAAGLEKDWYEALEPWKPWKRPEKDLKRAVSRASVGLGSS